jgi:hypothetical protein
MKADIVLKMSRLQYIVKEIPLSNLTILKMKRWIKNKINDDERLIGMQRF